MSSDPSRLPDAVRSSRPSVVAVFTTLCLADDLTINELIDVTGMCRETVSNALDDLEDATLVGSRTTAERGTPLRYWVLEPV